MIQWTNIQVYSQNKKSINWKNICTVMFIGALFTNVKIWNQPKYSSADEWIKNMIYILHYWEYCSSLKKERNWVFVTTWMNLENVMLIEINQEWRDKYMISVLEKLISWKWSRRMFTKELVVCGEGLMGDADCRTLNCS